MAAYRVNFRMQTKTISNERARYAVHGAAAYIRRGLAVLAHTAEYFAARRKGAV